MKKEQLTRQEICFLLPRRKILFLTSHHRFYFNLLLFFALINVIILIYFQGDGDLGVPLLSAVGSSIIGFLCCLTYFIDILTMNIKTIEEDGREVSETISHAKISVGNRIKVNSKNGSAKKLLMYDKVHEYSSERARINPRYDYKTISYYLGLSKVVVFTEYVPIGEKKKYNPKKKR